ncbi:MAG: hypothetical protein KGM17_03175 [Sphingomonadales bacterium]|nr:hypothetical protein [Sphingomonadales bacterium]
MGGLRRTLRDHRQLALLCALLALVVRVLVPAGMMLAPAGKSITIAICADASGLPKAQQIVVPGKPAPEKAHDGKVEGTQCGYGALAMAALGGADPVLLAAALALLMVLGLAAVQPARAGPIRRLRPPLRAPPLHA